MKTSLSFFLSLSFLALYFTPQQAVNSKAAAQKLQETNCKKDREVGKEA